MPKVRFPLAIEALHRGQTHTGELLNLQGKVCYNDLEYTTPSTATKVIATTWREVNGWKFWKYKHPASGEWEYISSLRGEQDSDIQSNSISREAATTPCFLQSCFVV